MSIPIHPLDSDTSTAAADSSERDVITTEFVIRIRVLDVITGRGLPHAYASKLSPYPADNDKERQLNRFARNPFRLNEGNAERNRVRFDHRDFNYFEVDFNIQRCRKMPTFTKEHQTYPSIFETSGMPTQSGSNKYIALAKNRVPLAYSKEKAGSAADNAPSGFFAHIEKEGKVLANRDWITNWDGVIEVPVTFKQFREFHEQKRGIEIEFKDFLIAPVDDKFSPAAYEAKTMVVSLVGSDPLDNQWEMAVGSEKQNLSDKQLCLPKVARSFEWAVRDTAPDIELWAVPKCKPYSDFSASPTVRQGNQPRESIEGIIIHYVSGADLKEKHSDGTAKPSSGQADDDKSNLHKNYFNNTRYLFSPSVNVGILNRVSAMPGVGNLGYHYFIDRYGVIIRLLEETVTANHAGKSRTPQRVRAITPDGVLYQDTSQVRSGLNPTFIGISLLGSHVKEKFHFTKNQIWALDRLIENIRKRVDGVTWKTILGHNEVRYEYNHRKFNEIVRRTGSSIDTLDSPTLQGRFSDVKAAKPDPGIALSWDWDAVLSAERQRRQNAVQPMSTVDENNYNNEYSNRDALPERLRGSGLSERDKDERKIRLGISKPSDAEYRAMEELRGRHYESPAPTTPPPATAPSAAATDSGGGGASPSEPGDGTSPPSPSSTPTGSE